ncbi:MAG: tRNA uridine(34) 5-carboxymethylaminomethyl modification radical SAM/GNAT enzyme Elp3 [Patescibacteria group bacterium]
MPQAVPPRKLMMAIMAEVLACVNVTPEMIDAAMRKHLRGTDYRFPKISELITAYRTLTKQSGRREDIERCLRCKHVRTDSGIAPITVLTKPYPCPGKCVYCPREARMPKSYVATEPAAARALTLHFDPYAQVARRVQSLEGNGHDAKKIELIVKGGTWSAYPWAYRQWFIKRCFSAANHLGSRNAHHATRIKRYGTLKASQKANESAEYRIIGLTIETRPDWVTPQEIVRLRELGVTRVEMGVQAIDDTILALTKRGCTVADTVRATTLLKAAGFKVDYHFVPGQPGSTPEHDVAMFKQLFSDERFCPDMVKIYPCVVIPSAELAEWHRAGTFKPLEGESLLEALIAMKVAVPYYCRLPRVVRDFPAQEISGGSTTSNLRDVIKQRMQERGLVCHCLRCREAGHREALSPGANVKLFVDEYRNAQGTELFLSMENEERTTCLSFLRLRLPDRPAVILSAVASDATKSTCPDRSIGKDLRVDVLRLLPELRDSAIVRELHTYGQLVHVGDKKADAVQHQGHGQRLMQEAEKIAKARGYKRLAVISGIGVRGYYRALGYRLAGTYMRKTL